MVENQLSKKCFYVISIPNFHNRYLAMAKPLRPFNSERSQNAVNKSSHLSETSPPLDFVPTKFCEPNDAPNMLKNLWE